MRGRSATCTAVLAATALLAVGCTDASVAFPADVTVAWDVSGGDLGEVVHGNPPAGVVAGDVWDEVVTAMPPFWSRRIEQLALTDDGPGGFAAAVRPLDDRAAAWRLVVDPADRAGARGRYVEVLVHELGHVVTLSDGVVVGEPDAVDLGSAQRVCDGPGVEGGCLVPGTRAHDFVATFWTADDRAAADRLHAADDGLEAVVRAAARQHDARRFVTPYAMTDPLEDLAETFTALVTGEPVAGVAADKVAWLRADPELAALAVRIRLALVDARPGAVSPRP